MQPYDPCETYVHLDTGPATSVIAVDDSFWATIGERTELHTGRLVTGSTMTADWDMWERHPHGDELIAVTLGAVRILVEHDGGAAATVATAPEFVMMPAGAWHTMDCLEPARLLIITWGDGTEHRPR